MTAAWDLDGVEYVAVFGGRSEGRGVRGERTRDVSRAVGP
jgi:hypothetical protein